MIDLHSHIIPNIDDGSKSMECTLKILEEAKKVGFTSVISTSHYIEGSYECAEEERKGLLDEIRKNISGIELYLGSEVFFSENMVELLKEKQASTINNSRYVLFEFPLNNKPIYEENIIYELRKNGYIPIVAHPERYSYVQDNIEFVRELAEIGALFQANYGSIVGLYGSNAKKTLKKLLKEDLITFFGSDVHRPERVYPLIPKAIKKIKKIVSDKKFEELSELNARKVLNDEIIEK